MDNGRLKRAGLKAFTVVSACFAASVVLTSAVSMVLGWSMEPGLILSMFVMFSVLWSLTVIRLIVSGSRWALSKPYIVKDLIFMPVYLVVAMLFVVFNFGIDLIAIGLAAGGVTSIGDSAFYGCSGFTGTLTIPDSVMGIEKARSRAAAASRGT